VTDVDDDPARLPAASQAEPPPPPGRLATLASAAWLGWKVESSWADPFVFAVYSVLKPVATAVTIIVMYRVVAGGPTTGDAFVFAFLGSAFHGFFQNILAGTTMVVVEDREFYETLHYVYISPASFVAYLIGRAAVRFVLTSVSAIVVLGLGIVLVGLPIHAGEVQWRLLAASLALGMACLTALGVLISGVALMLTHRVWYLMDAVSGLLFFFSGTLFPVSQLPGSLRWISYVLPTTYWMDLVRRALAPATARLSAFPPGHDTLLVAWMAGLTLASAVIGIAGFERLLDLARRRGYIHRRTHF
jgi:ABC-2 type transport system permease protein